jgi:imidazolonepropionase-like amidohydrolase
MTRKRVALIPTLKLWRYETRHLRRSLVQGLIDRGVAQLRSYAAAGGTILFGTDVGYMSDYDPTEEYEMMASAGLNFAAILASLTIAPAARFGLGDRTGRLAPGMDADLVVLRGDPASDIRALSAVRYTLRRGAVI